MWLDDLSRELIDSEGLTHLIDTHGVAGVTTNPTIFSNAIGSGSGYQHALEQAASRGLSAEDTVFELMCRDVIDACDVLTSVHLASDGVDGWVSIEVSPELAHDTAGTVAQAEHLWRRINRPNVMIKIPATEAGLPAITEALSLGMSVNATLIFSVTRYREVINAFLVGIERARANGHDIRQIHSVASFFVSRLDTHIDAKLTSIGTDQALHLKGKAGLANARLAHEIFAQSFTSERAKHLLSLGVHPQRPLWASTGVKDPTLPDTLYVEGLVASQVVNTMPFATLTAYADHGAEPSDTMTGRYRESDHLFNDLDRLGIDYSTVTKQLEAEGVQKFQDSWAQLVGAVEISLAGCK